MSASESNRIQPTDACNNVTSATLAPLEQTLGKMTDEQLHAHFDAVAVELKKRLTRKV